MIDTEEEKTTIRQQTGSGRGKTGTLSNLSQRAVPCT